MARICVFCSGSDAAPEIYRRTAREVGQRIAEGGHTLVYGGASCGLMGQLADGALERGGEVVGIMPSWLARKEITHPGLTEFVTVDTMVLRKDLMIERSDAFATLPGGVGTLDELFEVVTLVYLNRLSSPIALLNTEDYFAPLLATFQRGAEVRMIAQRVIDALHVVKTPEELLQVLVH